MTKMFSKVVFCRCVMLCHQMSVSSCYQPHDALMGRVGIFFQIMWMPACYKRGLKPAHNKDCALQVAADLLDKCVRTSSKGGTDCLQVYSKASNDSGWVDNLSVRVRGKPYTIPGAGEPFCGEAYIRAIPIMVSDVPCSIWITLATIWSHIFGEDFSSEMIANSFKYLPKSLAKVEIDPCHVRKSRKSILAHCRAADLAAPTGTWISSELQFNLSIYGIIPLMVVLSSKGGHYKLNDVERERARNLGKGFIDVCLAGSVCFSIDGTVFLFENLQLDYAVLAESQESLGKHSRLLVSY
jgi:hypothetical protein